MVKTKTDLTKDVKHIVYDSKAKIDDRNVAGEMAIPVETLVGMPAQYTSSYSRYVSAEKPREEVIEVVRGVLKIVKQEYNGHVTLEIENPLSGGKDIVRGGCLLQTEDKGLVAKFDSLKLIE